MPARQSVYEELPGKIICEGGKPAPVLMASPVASHSCTPYHYPAFLFLVANEAVRRRNVK